MGNNQRQGAAHKGRIRLSMQRNNFRQLLFNPVCLSILLHVLILLLFSIVLFAPKTKRPPHDYVPSYLYRERTVAQTPSLSSSAKALDGGQETSIVKQGALSLKQRPKVAQTDGRPHRPSMWALSQGALQTMQVDGLRASVSRQNQEPIYLVGQHGAFTDPLIKLVGKALSAHFHYPRLAGELGAKGKVLVGMILHPDGRFTNVQMVQSSYFPDLDAAALYAVNTAPLVMGANRFLSQPKYFVVGFIFN